MTRPTRRRLLATAAALGAGSLATACIKVKDAETNESGGTPAASRLPNIIVLYADDLGYADVSCYGGKSISTPNIDRLSAQGVRFTRGHCPSATCTPSRYALLTGEYAWRKDGAHILPGDAPALIQPGKDTVPAMLKRAGYATGVIGKWHLGLGDGHLDWNKPIKPGPLEIGFDYAYYFPATLDRVPTVFIDGHDIVGLDPKDPITVDYRHKVGNDPTGTEDPQLLRMRTTDGHNDTIVDGVSRIGWMAGGHAARWVDEDIADRLAGKAATFMEANRDKPFFLYFAPGEIHVPRLPAKRFQGKSGMGPRGDSILELDWLTGQLMATLDKLGLADNTLVVFSSDNGPVLDDGYADQAVELVGDHKPAGPFKSGKYSIFDGGLMVPMIARWPAMIKAGQTSDALIDHVDLFASFAALARQPLAGASAVDSFNLLPVLLGRSPNGRSFVVEDTSTVVAEKSTLGAHSDSILALVEGPWKYIEPHGAPAEFHGNPIGSAPTPQLYNVDQDPGETTNLADQHPDIVRRMAARLTSLQSTGRTRPT